ncbi:MAG TPA: aminotransferase class V-fold PLP-dependent enzyme [Thermoanaerobaculia bacterium]|nr:aminotransferase class V-fold PLP-dependent enzyme [Thermoanaerobaculia bacterium]
MNETETTDDRALLARWRADTPAAAHRIHLNNAGAALPPRSVLDAEVSYLEREAEVGAYELEAAEEATTEAAYGHVARLLGTAPRNVAIVESATVAFALALSAFDFSPGDRLVTTREDYPSNHLMYLALAARRGLEVVRAEDLAEGGADPESVRALAAHPRCRLVAVSWIPTSSGLIQPAEAIGRICEELGVPYLLDACQAVGELPIDFAALRCDYLAATARKFLRGPRGIGFLAVSDRALARGDYPLLPDMRGADWTGPDAFAPVDSARRFETWEFNYALVHGLGEAARYAVDEAGEAGGRRAIALAARVRERLAALPGVEIADRGARLGAIATATVAGREPRDLVLALRPRGINLHFSTRLGHFAPDPRPRPILRLSPHYYNTEDEIDRAIEALGELLR